MKAKVKKTGNVIILNEKVSLIEYARGMYRDTEGNKYHYKELEFIEEKVENPIDWEQRRYEIAKAAMQGIISNESIEITLNDENYEYYSFSKDIGKAAVTYADALITELKKGNKE